MITEDKDDSTATAGSQTGVGWQLMTVGLSPAGHLDDD
jgi:hypothetical protein